MKKEEQRSTVLASIHQRGVTGIEAIHSVFCTHLYPPTPALILSKANFDSAEAAADESAESSSASHSPAVSLESASQTAPQLQLRMANDCTPSPGEAQAFFSAWDSRAKKRALVSEWQMRRRPNALVASALNRLDRSHDASLRRSFDASATPVGDDEDKPAAHRGLDSIGVPLTPGRAVAPETLRERPSTQRSRGHSRTRSYPVGQIDFSSEDQPDALLLLPWGPERGHRPHPHLHHAANLADVSHQLEAANAANDPWRARASSMDTPETGTPPTKKKGSPRSLRKRLKHLRPRSGKRGLSETPEGGEPPSMERFAFSHPDLRFVVDIEAQESDTLWEPQTKDMAALAAQETAAGPDCVTPQAIRRMAPAATEQADPPASDIAAGGAADTVSAAEASEARTDAAEPQEATEAPEERYPDAPYEDLPPLSLGSMAMRLSDLELELTSQLVEKLAQFSKDYTTPLPPAPITLDVSMGRGIGIVRSARIC